VMVANVIAIHVRQRWETRTMVLDRMGARVIDYSFN